jgi:HK97 gp10 family phage protein
MAKKTVIAIENMEAVRAAFAALPERVRDDFAALIERTTFAIGQRTIANMPEPITGTQRESVTARSRGLRGTVTIDPDAFYWKFQEFGTKHQPARPFARPAAEAETPAFEQGVQRVGATIQREFGTSRFL